MKKIIGIILIVLSLVAFWVGLSIMCYSSGVSLWLSIIIPPCCYIESVLILGFEKLIAWLLS